MGHNVLHVAVYYVVPRMQEYPAYDPRYAQAREKALVPGMWVWVCVGAHRQLIDTQRERMLGHVYACQIGLSASSTRSLETHMHHTHQDLTPVMTSFPLVNNRAVHLGLSIRMVIAAKRFRS